MCGFDDDQDTESMKEIRIDIREFCLRMCKAARGYYENVQHEKDFGIYNTPVLDFIQITQEDNKSEKKKTIADFYKEIFKKRK